MKPQTMIFGDSYSTFEGSIPEGHAIYYYQTEQPWSSLTDVRLTWWHQVMTEAGLDLVRNDSWSGSTIGYTGYDNTDCSQSSSFIYRLRRLIDDGFFKAHRIERVFVFGGTNDSWSNAPLGEERHENWEEKDLYTVLPAIRYFLHLLRQTLPEAEIYCLINTDIKPEIVSCLKESGERYGMIPVTFDHIDKRFDHPTTQGMQDIKDRVLDVMRTAGSLS